MPQYVVVRVPDTGPPALAGAPSVIEGYAKTRASGAPVQADPLMSLHMKLDCIPVSGPLGPALDEFGTLL